MRRLKFLFFFFQLLVFGVALREFAHGDDKASTVLAENQAVITTRLRMEEIKSALKLFRKYTARYPLSLKELLTGTSRPVKLSPILKDEKQLLDGWEKPFLYQTNNNEQSYRLMSHGSDGSQGGTGEAADLIDKSPGFSPTPDQYEY